MWATNNICEKENSQAYPEDKNDAKWDTMIQL